MISLHSVYLAFDISYSYVRTYLGDTLERDSGTTAEWESAWECSRLSLGSQSHPFYIRSKHPETPEARRYRTTV